MRISAKSIIKPAIPGLPALSDTIRRLRQTLNYDLRSWAELLSISRRDCELLEQGKKEIDIVSLAELSRILNISLEHFAAGTIDWKAVAAQQSGDPPHHDFLGHLIGVKVPRKERGCHEEKPQDRGDAVLRTA